jgi:hypothetical protein
VGEARWRAARLMRRIDEFMLRKAEPTSNERNNLKFYLSNCVAAKSHSKEGTSS